MYGLVILDADDQRLKNIFAPIMKDELLHKTSWKAVSNTITNFVFEVYTVLRFL